MTHDEKIVEAVACAIFHARPRNRIWDALPNEFKNQYRKQARAAITAFQAEAWQPIETAPKDGTLILIGGWEIYHPEESPEWVESLVHWNGVCWDAEGAPVPLPNCSKWSPLPPNPPASP